MDRNSTPFESLQAAVEQAGSQVSLARICGVSQPAVWKWLQSAKRLPAEHCLAVEAATGISKNLLRPDIYPAELAVHEQTVAYDRNAILHRKTGA